ncbi:MAG: hypothetical protein HRT67_10605 [Flavobacteriaceae bacterium]|nr:hypothetical protein [Flavobacteriaceae bacterium]
MTTINLVLQKINLIHFIEQIDIVSILFACILFFLVLLVLGIIKFYKLKAENKKLSERVNLVNDTVSHTNDHNEGHQYS